MSLYDDDDPVTSDTLAGSKWSTGVTKFTPNLNKPKFGSLAGSGMFPSASGGGTGGGNNSSASSLSTPSSSLPPVINLNSKSGKRSDNFDSPAAKFSSYATSGEKVTPQLTASRCQDLYFDFLLCPLIHSSVIAVAARVVTNLSWPWTTPTGPRLMSTIPCGPTIITRS